MPIESITVTDAADVEVTLHATGGKRRGRIAQGFKGLPPIRQVIRPAPTRHGVINESHWTDGRLYVIDALIIGDDDADAELEFQAVAKALLESLEQGPAVLRWTEIGGLLKQAEVRLHGELAPPLEPGPALLRFQVQLLAEDPRAYSQMETTATGVVLSSSAGGLQVPFELPFAFTSSSGGSVSVTNNGNRPTPPVLRLYGAWTGARAQLDGTDPVQEIVFTGDVANGDYLEVDVARRTVMLNGTTDRIDLLDFAATTWFELPVGTSTLQMLAGAHDTSARLDVLKRDAYT